ncbi:hypothetical protein CapIbe_023970 [Capra ibex]
MRSSTLGTEVRPRGKPSPSDLQKGVALTSVLLSGAGPSEAARTPLRYSGSDRVFLPSTLRKISYSGHLLFGQGRLVSSSPAGEPGRQTAQTIQSQSGFTYARPKPRPKRVRRPGRAGPQAAWRVQTRRLGTRKTDGLQTRSETLRLCTPEVRRCDLCSRCFMLTESLSMNGPPPGKCPV